MAARQNKPRQVAARKRSKPDKKRAATRKAKSQPAPELAENKAAAARGMNGTSVDAEELTSDKPPRTFEPALCIVGDAGLELWGMRAVDRLKTQFAKAGVTDVLDLEDVSQRNGPVILVRSDAIIDQPLVPILAKRPNLILTDGVSGRAIPLAVTATGLDAAQAAALLSGEDIDPASLKMLVRAPADLDAAFWKGLRKREVPYAMIAKAEDRADVEWRMFMGTYKGATDVITKHVWPVPAFYATRALAPTRITPNMVTTLGAICVALAFWLFLEGHFAAGLVAAWAMTFLDTVDGKLARTTLTSSKWGDIFDHGIDLIHPPFWYIAWGYGLAAAGFVWSGTMLWTVLGIIFAGYVLQRLMEGAAIKWLGMEIHIWRPIDTLFRQITARRNPNLALMTLSVVAGRPDIGLLAVAAWTGICLILHGVQLAQAFAARRKDGELTSWMKQPQRTQ